MGGFKTFLNWLKRKILRKRKSRKQIGNASSHSITTQQKDSLNRKDGNRKTSEFVGDTEESADLSIATNEHAQVESDINYDQGSRDGFYPSSEKTEIDSFTVINLSSETLAPVSSDEEKSDLFFFENLDATDTHAYIVENGGFMITSEPTESFKGCNSAESTDYKQSDATYKDSASPSESLVEESSADHDATTEKNIETVIGDSNTVFNRMCSSNISAKKVDVDVKNCDTHACEETSSTSSMPTEFSISVGAENSSTENEREDTIIEASLSESKDEGSSTIESEDSLNKNIDYMDFPYAWDRSLLPDFRMKHQYEDMRCHQLDYVITRYHWHVGKLSWCWSLPFARQKSYYLFGKDFENGSFYLIQTKPLRERERTILPVIKKSLPHRRMLNERKTSSILVGKRLRDFFLEEANYSLFPETSYYYLQKQYGLHFAARFKNSRAHPAVEVCEPFGRGGVESGGSTSLPTGAPSSGGGARGGDFHSRDCSMCGAVLH